MKGMMDRCAWGSKSIGRGVCDKPCKGRYCERHTRVVAVRDAGAALRAAREAVAKARDAVVEAARAAAGRWSSTPWVPYDEGDSGDIADAVAHLKEAERVEAEARARLEALR